jgi:hypothetical protein
VPLNDRRHGTESAYFAMICGNFTCLTHQASFAGKSALAIAPDVIDLEHVHFSPQGNQRKRERGVGSRTTNSGASLSKPVAGSNCKERSATGANPVSNI